jgi:hypothetical protein
VEPRRTEPARGQLPARPGSSGARPAVVPRPPVADRGVRRRGRRLARVREHHRRGAEGGRVAAGQRADAVVRRLGTAGGPGPERGDHAGSADGRRTRSGPGAAPAGRGRRPRGHRRLPDRLPGPRGGRPHRRPAARPGPGTTPPGVCRPRHPRDRCPECRRRREHRGSGRARPARWQRDHGDRRDRLVHLGAREPRHRRSPGRDAWRPGRTQVTIWRSRPPPPAATGSSCAGTAVPSATSTGTPSTRRRGCPRGGPKGRNPARGTYLPALQGRGQFPAA